MNLRDTFSTNRTFVMRPLMTDITPAFIQAQFFGGSKLWETVNKLPGAVEANGRS